MSAIEPQQSESLVEPVVLLALRGWFDAGGAATGALKWIEDHYELEKIGEIEADGFFDFQQERPVARLDDQGRREIVWPSTSLYLATSSDADPFVIVRGTEPHLRWREYLRRLDELLGEFESPRIITLGAMAGGVPHTRQFVTKGSSAKRSIAMEHGLQRPRYEGPTGMFGVLHQQLDARDHSGISLWVPVPHYVIEAPSPKATHSLLRAVQRVSGIPTMHEELHDAAVEWELGINSAMDEDDQLMAYVRRLEEHVDAEVEEEIESGESVADALQDFLREQVGE